MKNKFFGNRARVVSVGILVLSIILLAFWIRIQEVTQLPHEQFTEHDAYLYYWQANIISEHGRLPTHDMHRWLPLGRDNQQLLSLYAYAIAYIHKAVVWIFPNLTLYHIQIYLPVICFTLGLCGLCLLLVRSYGILFAATVGLLLATLPGSIERSAIGFGDRDAWCWMLGTLSITIYIWKEQIKPGWQRYLITTLSGFTVFLGGLSWEGFGSFLLIILAAELWKFCTTEREHHLKEYILWMAMFIPWLILISPAYRSGYGFSTHIAAFMLFPPLTIFLLRSIRYVLLKHIEYFHGHARKLAWFLTLFAITTGIAFIFLQTPTFEATAFPFDESQLMNKIGELGNPHFKYWKGRYGAVFVAGSFGLIVVTLHLWKLKSLPLVSSLALFISTTFFRDFVSVWTNPNTCDILFFLSLGGILISMVVLAYFQREYLQNDFVVIAMLTWFIFWIALSRGGKRYDFFIGVPLAFFTTELIQFFIITNDYSVKETIKHKVLKISIVTAILAGLMFFPPLGNYVKHSLYAATSMRKVIPGNSSMITAFNWIKTYLPRTAVVAAKWGHGTQLNVFGGVKTIIDPDHYIPHWIYLYNQHVAHTESEREFLEFLKTHGATHILLTRKDFVTNPFLREQGSDALIPVYPTENFSDAYVKIWEIHYPPSIQSKQKYLATELEHTEEK